MMMQSVRSKIGLNTRDLVVIWLRTRRKWNAKRETVPGSKVPKRSSRAVHFQKRNGIQLRLNLFEFYYISIIQEVCIPIDYCKVLEEAKYEYQTLGRQMGTEVRHPSQQAYVQSS